MRRIPPRSNEHNPYEPAVAVLEALLDRNVDTVPFYLVASAVSVISDPNVSLPADNHTFFDNLLHDIGNKRFGDTHKPITLERIREAQARLATLKNYREPRVYY